MRGGDDSEAKHATPRLFGSDNPVKQDKEPFLAGYLIKPEKEVKRWPSAGGHSAENELSHGSDCLHQFDGFIHDLEKLFGTGSHIYFVSMRQSGRGDDCGPRKSVLIPTTILSDSPLPNSKVNRTCQISSPHVSLFWVVNNLVSHEQREIDSRFQIFVDRLPFPLVPESFRSPLLHH